MTAGLCDLRDSNGRFSILAIDHRDSLRRFLRPEDPDSIPAGEITTLKIELVAHLADLVTGVMLEPEFSIPHVIDAGVLPQGVGFLAALESQGYLDDPAGAVTSILDGWSIAQAKASGASAAKLLLPYHPERPRALEQQRVAFDVIAACRTAGLPLALEPLFYDLDSPDDRARVVLATVSTFAAMEPDLLKLPYPGSPEACAAVSEIVTMPWAMLSGGGTFVDFVEEFTIARTAGCSGFMVGRALWGEAVHAAPAHRAQLLDNLVRPRLELLVQINA